MSYRPFSWSVLHFPDHASLRILPFELRSLRQASSLLHKALNFLYYKKKTGVNKSPSDRVLIALFSSLPCVVTLRFFLAECCVPRSLQKGGVPAAPSGTATLLRLSPNHQFCPRSLLAVTNFRHPRLSWLDGRCVQGPGTYSPRHG